MAAVVQTEGLKKEMSQDARGLVFNNRWAVKGTVGKGN
jgi:hypothetical protein